MKTLPLDDVGAALEMAQVFAAVGRVEFTRADGSPDTKAYDQRIEQSRSGLFRAPHDYGSLQLRKLKSDLTDTFRENRN